MTRILASLLLLLLASPTFAADVFVKFKTHSDALAIGGQSQPARDAVAEQWYGPGRTAQSSGDTGFIVDLGEEHGLHGQPPRQVVRGAAAPD